MTTASEYACGGHRRVRGWLGNDSAALIVSLSNQQCREGTRGSVVEIGVHHGKLFILLALLRQPGEAAVAIDVFEAQHLNIDGSGAGDRTMFESNLARFGVDLTDLTLISKTSLDVLPDEIIRAGGGQRVRLFSIDGGHTAATTVNDLKLAEETLTDDGIVVLDDVFTSIFPGVSSGLAQYLGGGGTLTPYAISPEKTLLTTGAHADARRHTLIGLPNVLRTEVFHGHEVVLFTEKPKLNAVLQQKVAASPTYARIRTNPLMTKARPAVLRLMRR